MNKQKTLPIGEEEILKAQGILEEYRRGKRVLENRIRTNDRWYRMRHWEYMEHSPSQVQPASAWLFNAILTKHADMMDAFPRPAILPREAGDKEQAAVLSALLPVVLEQADFEKVYSSVMEKKLKSGTGIYGVLWDAACHNGLGDIAIKSIDPLSLYWEPGVEDIQSSANLFYVTSQPARTLLEKYPELRDKAGDLTPPPTYIQDEAIDGKDKITVVDWYYKTLYKGKTYLHYAKFALNTLLYATENLAPTAGLYDHGLYPFIFDSLFTIEGSPCGFGYIDVAKPAQEYIDRSNQAILQNLLSNARPRYFIRADGAVKESEFADMTKDFIHVDGNLGQDSVLPVQGRTLPDVYLAIVNAKIDELKETTGNRDVSAGGVTGGVTAASVIAMLDRELPNKFSTDEKLSLLASFEHQLYTLLLQSFRPCPPPHTELATTDRLYLSPPFDRLYLFWLEAQIFYLQGDITRHNNAQALYNRLLEQLKRYLLRTRSTGSASIHYF